MENDRLTWWTWFLFCLWNKVALFEQRVVNPDEQWETSDVLQV